MHDRIQALVQHFEHHPDDLALAFQTFVEALPAAITQPHDAFRHLLPLLRDRDTEAFAVLALDRQHRPLGATVLTTGTTGFTLIDPRQVLAWALRQGPQGAHAIVVAHNHPSGCNDPSAQDLEATRRLSAAGQVVNIRLLDHLIIAKGRFTSITERHPHLTNAQQAWTPIVAAEQ